MIGEEHKFTTKLLIEIYQKNNESVTVFKNNGC